MCCCIMHATVHIFRYMRVFCFLGHFIEEFLLPGKHPKCNGREGEGRACLGVLPLSIIASEYIIFALSLVSRSYFFIGIITTNLFFRNGLPLGFIHWKFSFWFFIMNAWRQFCFLLFKNEKWDKVFGNDCEFVLSSGVSQGCSSSN